MAAQNAPGKEQTVSVDDGSKSEEIVVPGATQEVAPETTKQEKQQNPVSPGRSHAKALEAHKKVVRLNFKATIYSIGGKGSTVTDLDDDMISVTTKGGHGFTACKALSGNSTMTFPCASVTF